MDHDSWMRICHFHKLYIHSSEQVFVSLTSIELAPGRRSKAASWEEVAEFVLVQDESELDNQNV